MTGPSLELDPAAEEAELREYLGAEFDRSRLEGYRQTLADEVRELGDEGRIYRESRAYLYNLTAFAMTRTKLPYLGRLTRIVPPPARVLDYGCGIGSDGLLLLGAGYEVEFADFRNPSTEYLRWRLGRRGLDAPVHDLEVEVPGGFDAAYSFDVIEHVADPSAFLGELETRARIVVVNLLESEEDDQPMHRALPIAAIRRRAARRGVLAYRVYHGRSHLLAYSSPPRPWPARLLGIGRLAGGRARRIASRVRGGDLWPSFPVKRFEEPH